LISVFGKLSITSQMSDISQTVGRIALSHKTFR